MTDNIDYRDKEIEIVCDNIIMLRPYIEVGLTDAHADEVMYWKRLIEVYDFYKFAMSEEIMQAIEHEINTIADYVKNNMEIIFETNTYTRCSAKLVMKS